MFLSFQFALNLGTFPSVRKVDSHAHTHSLFSRVFVLLSHSHTRTIPTQRGDCLVVPLLFAIVSGFLFFLLVLFKLIYLNERIFALLFSFFYVNFCSPSLRFSKQYFTRFILVLAFLFLQLSEAVVGLACFFSG